MVDARHKLFYSIISFLALVHTYQYAAEKPTTSASDQDTGASDQDIDDVGDTFSIALGCLTFAEELYHIGRATRLYIAPTSDEQEKAEKVVRDIERLTSLRAFRSCLIRHKNASEKNSAGLPEACKKSALEYESIGGKYDVERLVGILKKYSK